LKIPDAEQKAIDAAIEAKFPAREELQAESLQLYCVAVDPDADDAALDRAVKGFLEAKDRFQRRFREIDEVLVKRISPRTRAKMLTTGTLENGLGFLGTRSPIAPGPPAAGGPPMTSPHRGASGFGTAGPVLSPAPEDSRPAPAAGRAQPSPPVPATTGEAPH
jgi:hypothetical protein